MSNLDKTTFSDIMQTSGRVPTNCNCERCKEQCHTPCLGTPEDIERLIDAGYDNRLTPVWWCVGMIMGVTDKPIKMVQARLEDNGWCTFYHNGLCELHDKGLKPTEGRLSHHTIGEDNFNPRKSLAWLVAKEWLPLQTLIP